MAGMTNALLLAEPEPATRDYHARQLADDGFDVVDAAHGGHALDLVERTRPDLVLAWDTDLVRRLREGEPGRTWDRDVPVIVLAAEHTDAVDRVRAFERGADDVLERPFSYQELVARIRAVLRRAAPPRPDRVEVGELVVDRTTRRAALRGVALPLSGKELALLAKLAEEPSRVFGKQELLRDVWGFRSLTQTRTLDSHASRLRRKLALTGDDAYVINVWGVGYRLLD